MSVDIAVISTANSVQRVSHKDIMCHVLATYCALLHLSELGLGESIGFLC